MFDVKIALNTKLCLAPIAQRIEQWSSKSKVLGSSPSGCGVRG